MIGLALDRLFPLTSLDDGGFALDNIFSSELDIFSNGIIRSSSYLSGVASLVVSQTQPTDTQFDLSANKINVFADTDFIMTFEQIYPASVWVQIVSGQNRSINNLVVLSGIISSQINFSLIIQVSAQAFSGIGSAVAFDLGIYFLIRLSSSSSSKRFSSYTIEI